MRLDIYLTEHNLAQSRERAKKLIKNNRVKVNSLICAKPSREILDNDIVECDDSKSDYVGRGLIKLETAFENFNIDITDKICADIGASTGGFTQFMLRNGAKQVYAIDVGHGQLDISLINDPRVVNCEGVNARYLTHDFFENKPEFISVDISFISLTLVLPALVNCLTDNGDIVVLIKPQFEAGKAALNKKGIVRDKKDHIRVIENLLMQFSGLGLSVGGIVPSAIQGGDGNIEYLAYLRKTHCQSSKIDTKQLVDNAFNLFANKKD